MIESFFDQPSFEYKIDDSIVEFLGFEFVGADMQSSCSYADLCYDALFNSLLPLLNNNYLFNTIYDIQQYIGMRESFKKQGHELESYFYPRIVRLSEIHDSKYLFNHAKKGYDAKT